jgi:hypothetical protein
MVAVTILRKPPSIWYIDFLGKVPLLALNVRPGAIASGSDLLILISLGFRYHLFRRVCGRLYGCAFELPL